METVQICARKNKCVCTSWYQEVQECTTVSVLDMVLYYLTTNMRWRMYEYVQICTRRKKCVSTWYQECATVSVLDMVLVQVCKTVLIWCSII